MVWRRRGSMPTHIPTSPKPIPFQKRYKLHAFMLLFRSSKERKTERERERTKCLHPADPRCVVCIVYPNKYFGTTWIHLYVLTHACAHKCLCLYVLALAWRHGVVKRRTRSPSCQMRVVVASTKPSHCWLASNTTLPKTLRTLNKFRVDIGVHGFCVRVFVACARGRRLRLRISTPSLCSTHKMLYARIIMFIEHG